MAEVRRDCNAKVQVRISFDGGSVGFIAFLFDFGF